MKKLIAVVVIVTIIASCNSNSNNNPGSPAESSSADSAKNNMTTAIIEGTMAMKNGDVKVLKDHKWVPLNEPYTCTDGCKVMPNGEVYLSNGRKMTLKEGQMVERNGTILDANGQVMLIDKIQDSTNKQP